MDFDKIDITDNQGIHNFEMMVDGHRAFIDYKIKDDKIYLIHTEVPAGLKGRGVAEAMVEKTLTYIERHQLKLVPLCSYIQTFLKRYPSWNRLLA